MTTYNPDFDATGEDKVIKIVTELVEDQNMDESLAENTIYNWDIDGTLPPTPPPEKIKHATYEGQRVFLVQYAQDPIDAINAKEPMSNPDNLVGIPLMGDIYPTVWSDYPTNDPPLSIAEQYNIIAYAFECANVDNLEHTHKVTVKYKSFPQDKDERWEMRNTGDTAETNYAIDNQQKFPSTALEMKNVIGVGEDGSVEGVSVPDKMYEFNVIHWKDKGDFTGAYQLGVQGQEGQLNNADFYGFGEGNVLFKTMEIVSDNSLIVELKFTFLINAEIPEAKLTTYFKDKLGVNIPIDVDKEGWQYLWARYASKDETTGTLPYTKGAYIADIYEKSSDNFATLGLSGKLGV